MSGAPASKLRLNYLVGGMPLPDGGFAEGSLRLLTNVMFARPGPRGPSIVGTDDAGVLSSFRSDLSRDQPLQTPAKEPLTLAPFPRELVRQAVLGIGDQWQTELIGFVQGSALRNVQTLPMVFTAKHVIRPPAEDRAGTKIWDALNAQGKLSGHLLPQLRVLIVLFDSKALTSPPEDLEATCGERKITLSSIGKPVAIEIPGTKKGTFLAYCTGEPGLDPGRYVVSVPRSALAARLRAGPLRRTFEVAFGVRTFAAEFDFHVFEFSSAESAILTHFPELFPHILQPEDLKLPDAQPTPAFAAGETQTLVARAERAIEEYRTKLTAGFMNAQNIVGLSALFSSSLQAVAKVHPSASTGKQKGMAASRASAVAGGSLRDVSRQLLGGDVESGWRAAAALSLDAWAAHDAAHAAFDKWQKLPAWRAAAAAFAKVQPAHGATSIKQVIQLYQETRWRNKATDLIASHSAGNANLFGRYLTRRQHNLDPGTIDRLIKKALEPSLYELAQGWEQRALGGVNWVFDVSSSVRSLIHSAHALSTLSADESAARSQLLDAADEHHKQYRARPCSAALTRIDALRRTVDAATVATADARDEVLLDSYRAVTGVLKLIPALGPPLLLLDAAEASARAGAAAISVACDAIDKYVWRFQGARDRMVALYQLHAQQVREIEKGGRGEDDPHLQLRVRLCTVIGLLGLIERCGSRGAKGQFESRVAKYRIGEYVKTFLSPASSSMPKVALSPGTPLDEYWMYTRCNATRAWDEILDPALISQKVTDTSWLMGRLHVPVSYHDHFPCYGMSSSSQEALARAFSRNFSAVADSEPAFFAVYVRRKNTDPWVVPSKATWAIGPFTPVRVVVVFKSGEDLSGTPLSLQLKRADEWSPSTGPVYRAMLARAFASQGGGDDKGLLAETDERRFISDKHAYSAVFFPFYFYKANYIDGLKPFGVIRTGDRQFDVGFTLKVGDDTTRKDLYVENDKDSLTVRFPSGRVYDEMLTDRDFLRHKESGAYTKRLFVEDRVWVAGVFAPGSKGYQWFGADKPKEPITLRAGGELVFRWDKDFDFIVVIFGEGAGVDNFSEDPVKIPSQLSFAREGRIFDDRGPEYPVEFVSLHKPRRIREITTGDLSTMLSSAGMGVQFAAEQASLKFPDEGSLFAARVSPYYELVSLDGSTVSRSTIKPFGNLHLCDAAEIPTTLPYKYSVSIAGANGLGLALPDALKLELPPVPRSIFDGTKSQGRYDAITDDKYWKLLRIGSLR